mmetsp:Transcript_34377/g.77477  ORF Transcript_34377/g.77477 Transcript_34377/m.77477 type:complete len:319 (+) Transcript_34377:61-1017(+)
MSYAWNKQPWCTLALSDSDQHQDKTRLSSLSLLFVSPFPSSVTAAAPLSLFILSDLSHEGSHFFSVHHLALQQSLAEDLCVIQPTQAGFPKVASQEEESVDGLLAIDLLTVKDPQVVLVVQSCLLEVKNLLRVEFAELVERHALPVSVLMRSLVTLNRLGVFIQTFVALTHRAPHPRVVGTKSRRFPEVVQGVEVHLKDLVRLTEAVPRAVVAAVDVKCSPVGLDGCRRVSDLDVFVAHECPSREVVRVKLQGALKIENCLFVLTLERVVIANDTACLRSVFLVLHGTVSNETELCLLFFHVQDVRVRVNVVQAIWIL